MQPSLQALEQAVQLQPSKALYRNNAATVLVEMHQDQRALAHLAAVHGAADANYNLGQLLVERNRAADAAPYFQAALQQNPGMQQAQVRAREAAGDANCGGTASGRRASAGCSAGSCQPIASNMAMQYGQPIGAQQFASG